MEHTTDPDGLLRIRHSEPLAMNLASFTGPTPQQRHKELGLHPGRLEDVPPEELRVDCGNFVTMKTVEG